MRYSPYLRTRTIDDGAIALVRTADACRIYCHQ